MNKTQNNMPWFLVLSVFILVMFSAIIPLMTAVNYSVQDIFGQNTAHFVDVQWYQEVLQNPRLQDALLRQFMYSGSALTIEIPLVIVVALMMPTWGAMASLTLIVLATSLLIRWLVIGTVCQLFSRADIGLVGHVINSLGIDYNYANNAIDAWLIVVLMDVWHWTSLIALLCYSGLRAIPDAYYQVAKIDRASYWMIFKFIQLPKLKGVLIIGILLRFMDSFMIYTDPFVLSGGGPGSSTTFLSQTLTKMAIEQFDIGAAAVLSMIYFLIVLLISWLFFTTISQLERQN